MSSSELEKLVAELAKVQRIPVDPEWLPAIALHLRRLVDASKIVEQANAASVDIAPRFEA
jgi:hypothetical protein